MSHTPGPWEVSSTYDFLDCGISQTLIIGGKRLWVAYAITDSNNKGEIAESQRDANANLIAAAPDLLEALEELVNIINGIREGDDYRIDSFTLHPAEIAIAKARRGA